MGRKSKQRGRGQRNVAPGQDGFPRGNLPPGLPAGLPQLNQHWADWCPECEVTYDCNSTDRRDVTDTCGHRKCRNCIVTKDICPQCSPQKRAAISGPRYLVAQEQLSEARYPQDGPGPSSSIQGIGQEPNRRRKFSGTPKPFMNRASSSSGGTSWRSVSSESSTSVKSSATQSSSSYTSPGVVERRAMLENRRNPASQRDFIMADLTINTDRSASLAIGRPKLVPTKRLRRAPTDSFLQNATFDLEQISSTSTSDSLAGPSTSSSPEEVKQKKKRHPVIIFDHITVLGGHPPHYQCNVCMKKFKTKNHVKYHEFCQKGEKPFKCGQCGRGFIAKSHYEYHLRTHTGERPYVCPKCGKGFNQRGKVTRHLRSHTGEKPFICQQCGRGFANAQALRAHVLIHTGERPFACQYCNKRFTGMTNLKKHVITHTGERPFQCNHCGKSFGLKWTLDLHMRTHSTERPYACEQCSRAFSNSKDLRRHLVIHSGERPFRCSICGTAFRRKDNLDRHIKNTHNQPKEVAKQLADEAAAEYMAKQNEAKAAAAGADDVPSASTGEVEGLSGDQNQSHDDPLDLHQPATEDSEDNRRPPQTSSIVVTADGKFIREANDACNQDITPQIVNVCSIAETRRQRIPAQEVISTNGNGQTVHQILSPRPAYYHVPENNDRRVVYVIQHPHAAPVHQETLLYTNSNAVATEVIRDNHVRYATSQTPARIVDAATGQIIRFPTLSQEAGPYSATAQYHAQPSGRTVNFPPPGMLFRRNWDGTVSRVETVSRSSNPAATVVPSFQQGIRYQHYYATSNEMPALLSEEQYTRSRERIFEQEDGGNEQQVHLARASATVPQMQDSDYQRPAQNSQESRHNGIPHRGHREQYVFQQPK